MTGKKPFNPFWILLTASATLFCVSALAWIAAGFGDHSSPLAEFMNRHGARLIGIEAAATIVLAFLALAVDSRQTRRSKTQISEGGCPAGERDPVGWKGRPFER